MLLWSGETENNVIAHLFYFFHTNITIPEELSLEEKFNNFGKFLLKCNYVFWNKLMGRGIFGQDIALLHKQKLIKK